MSNADLRALLATELEAIPRGDQGQNTYRMVFEQARLNGLGSHAEVPATQAAAHAFALRTVRLHDPDFNPTLKTVAREGNVS